MKKHLKIIFTLFIILCFSSAALAEELTKSNKKLSYDQVETNLLIGLKSNNFGLKVSSAYMLGEIKSEAAIIPLSKMLREETDERARLVAALSLIKIGTDRSVYVVKQGRRFNEYNKVKHMCEHLYNAHLAATFKGKVPDKETLFAYLSGNQL